MIVTVHYRSDSSLSLNRYSPAPWDGAVLFVLFSFAMAKMSVRTYTQPSRHGYKRVHILSYV